MQKKSFFRRCFLFLIVGLIAGVLIGSCVSILWKSGFYCREKSSFSCKIKERQVKVFLDGTELLWVDDCGDHEVIYIIRRKQPLAVMCLDDSNPSKGVISTSFMMDNRKEGKIWCDVLNCDFSDEGDSIEFKKRPYPYGALQKLSD